MRNILSSTISYRVIRITLGAIFLYSGVPKILDPASFAEIIRAFGLVPGPFRGYAALMIASAEIIAGTGLILDRRGSLTAIFSMLIMFSLVLIYGIYMGFDIDCGCFGSDDPVGNAFHGLRSSLAKDLILISCCIYLYIWRKTAPFRQYSRFLFRKTVLK